MTTQMTPQTQTFTVEAGSLVLASTTALASILSSGDHNPLPVEAQGVDLVAISRTEEGKYEVTATFNIEEQVEDKVPDFDKSATHSYEWRAQVEAEGTIEMSYDEAVAYAEEAGLDPHDLTMEDGEMYEPHEDFIRRIANEAIDGLEMGSAQVDIDSPVSYGTTGNFDLSYSSVSTAEMY